MRKFKGMLSESLLGLFSELGENIDFARKRRRLTIETVCSRAGITAQTYNRLIRGEAGVSIGVLGAVLHALSLEQDLVNVASPKEDDVGIALERTHAAKRVRNGDNNELDTDF